MIRRDFIKGALAGGLIGEASSLTTVAKPSQTRPTAGPKPRMMFYHDGRHPLIYNYEPPMQKEEYQTGADELAGTPIQAIMFGMGDGRTVLHDTQVGELWGHHIEKWSHLIFRRAYQNAKGLIEAGLDPLQLICDRTHALGMALYPVLLVQQGTGKRDEDMRASEFRLNNRHLEIGAAGGVDADFPGFHGLNFKHEEVREERFSLIQETLNRYPIDGLELQLNYLPYYFHPKQVEEGREVMTGWIERIHQAVKNSGSERELAIRIPASLEGCYSVGLDVREWIRKGLVDVLIGQNFSHPELVDQMADFRPLAEAAQGSSCRVHAALHSHVDTDRLSEASIAMIRAGACNYWAQGVDGLYLAHWFNNWPYRGSFYEKLRELPYPEIMASRDKHYFVTTSTRRYREPVLEPGLSMQLPVDLPVQQPVAIDFSVSDDLSRWHQVGRVHQVLLRLRITSTTELDRLEFVLNGNRLPEEQLRKINRMYYMKAPRYRAGGYWFIYDLDPHFWPQSGANHLQVTLTRRDPDVTPPVFLHAVELEIKYLMGKNFDRSFRDPALGSAVAFGDDFDS